MTPTVLALPYTGVLRPLSCPQPALLRAGVGLPPEPVAEPVTEPKEPSPPSFWLNKDPHTGFTHGETAATGLGFVVATAGLLSFLGTRPAQAPGPWRHFGNMLLAASCGALAGVFTPNLIKGLQRWLSTDDANEVNGSGST